MSDTELNALVSRIADGIDNDASWPLDGKRRRDAADALDTLVAEVERLRAGVAEERAAVVACLRRLLPKAQGTITKELLDTLADLFERGEHRRPEEAP